MASKDADEVDLARRKLLRAAAYVAPAVVSVVTVERAFAQPPNPSCGPSLCLPRNPPCQPGQCFPNAGPCGPNSCNPRG